MVQRLGFGPQNNFLFHVLNSCFIKRFNLCRSIIDDFKLFLKLMNMLNSFAKFTFITLHGFGIIDSNHLIRFPKEHMKLICDNITYLVIYFDLLDDHIGYISLSFFIYHVSQFARFIWYIIQRKKTPT